MESEPEPRTRIGHRISFRTRVFLLVVAVAASTAGATAWLLVVLSANQATPATSPALPNEDLDRVVEKIATHGMLHNNWNDAGDLARELAAGTDRRIRIRSAYGTILGDSDPSGDDLPPQQSAVVETRPALLLDVVGQVEHHASAAVMAIRSYRHNLQLAKCWRGNGIALKLTRTPLGVNMLAPDPRPVPADHCVADAPDGPLAAEEIAELDKRCGAATDSLCVRTAFAQAITALAPPSLVLMVGTVEQPQPPAGVGIVPALVSAGIVTLIVVAVSLLISRRVLHPIRALATASRQLSSGDLSGRVPERGRDELADLTRWFNRMAESLQRSKEQQRNMIADIAHELRTPTTNIRGYVEAMQDGVFPADEELFRSLHEEAVLQERLINDLQDLALAESGTLVYHRSPAELTELLRAVRTAHSTTAATRDIRIELDGPGPVPVVVDPDRIRQVIGNLMTNALNATSPGGVITLRARTEGGTAVIEVADTGCGIASEDLAHVFDRFWRADSARGRHTGGRGLGLAIAREIIAAHAGTITVTSTVGTGTTFTVRLPLEQRH
ncbi:sensor histidine kinase [Lentzea sp. NPDC051213]|uniref:sensor histidine kinase n=1 Tax=Lentzea sp. NPDC051213 TaxID=3364126 RepID=UPI0037B0709C